MKSHSKTKFILTRRLASFIINRAKKLLDDKDGHYYRRNSYTENLASLLDTKDGIPCFHCKTFIPLMSTCISKHSSTYSSRRHFHLDCAKRLHIW